MVFAMLICELATACKYVFPDGSWTAVRSSGTEPKIEFYSSVRAADESHAHQRLAEITARFHAALGLALGRV